jgi:hypothetical protein
MATDDITFIPHFMKIGKLVDKLKGSGTERHSMSISLSLFFFHKEGKLKMQLLPHRKQTASPLQRPND